MPGNPQREDLLVTPRQRALCRILIESGASEDGKDADGEPFTDGPPILLTMMIDAALNSDPTEDQLVDILCWGDRAYSEKVRPVARRILALLHSHGAPPA